MFACFTSSGSIWLQVVPWGIRRVLNFIKNNYGNPPVIITENGVSDTNGTLEDNGRVAYYRDYINNILKGSCHVIKTQQYSEKLD